MKVLCVCSGGIDSSSMVVKYRDENLELLSFKYGQKGEIELSRVADLASFLRVPHKTIDISFMKELYGDSNQLTSSEVEIKESYADSIVVPLRNAVFLQIAYVYGLINDVDKILFGSHLGDVQEVDGERMYPDCSSEFFKAFALAMDLGTWKKDRKIIIETPSMLNLTKVDLITSAYDVVGDFVFTFWSCYSSGRLQCGTCESCRNRKAAFAEAGIEDKTEYEV